MSRRRNTPEQEISRAKKAPTQAAPQVHREANPESLGTRLPATVPEPPAPTLPIGAAFAARTEIDAAMDAYRRNPGICPICRGKIGRGASGHIAKCLRLSKFRTESTATS